MWQNSNMRPSQTSPAPHSPLTQTWVPQLVLLPILVLAAYAGVRDHYFVWDTLPFVLENPWIHEWTWSNTVSILSEAHRANWHPLVLFSHAIDFSLFGQNSGAHHLMNILYHAINTCLIYLLVYRLIRLLRLGQITDSTQALWIAWITAAIFAIHPQHVESVAWIVERKDVLYTLMTLLTLLTYLSAAENPNWKTRALPFVMFILALSAKPMAVTLPLILLLIDIYPLKRITSVKQFVIACAAKTPYWLVSGAVILITLSTQSMAMPDESHLPLWVRSLNAIDNTWFYVQHYLWPLKLSPFYPYPENLTYLQSPAFWLPGLVFLSSTLIAGIVLACRGYLWPIILILFYLITLAPVSGLIHVGPAKGTDHYVYLATLPLSLVTALVIVYAWTYSRKLQIPAATLTMVYLTFLLMTTQLQVSYWHNPLTLWTRVVTLHPDSAFGHRNLAAAYLQINERQLALQHAELSMILGSPDRVFVENVRSIAGKPQENPTR